MHLKGDFTDECSQHPTKPKFDPRLHTDSHQQLNPRDNTKTTTKKNILQNKHKVHLSISCDLSQRTD